MKRTHTDLQRRQMLLTLGLLGLGGCWGSFNLTGRVHDWNGSFNSKWVSWLVFLAFIILPVYGILLFIDALIINTIEFYSGKNPVQRSADLGGGRHLVLTPTARAEVVHVQISRHERVLRSFYIEKLGDEEFRLLDERGRQVAHARGELGGVARLRDHDGNVVGHLERAQQRRIVEAAQRRESVAEVAVHELGENGEIEGVLAMATDLPHAARI